MMQRRLESRCSEISEYTEYSGSKIRLMAYQCNTIQVRWVYILFVTSLMVASIQHRVLSEDSTLRGERFDGLIESLNTTSSGRERILETIFGELRGHNGREMQETLHSALSRQNTLILLGVVEAMAMLGDPKDVAGLEALLATTDKLEVKAQVIRLLPAFCLQSERARFNYINYAVGYDRTVHADVLEPLRRPPITRRGRLDTSLERLQVRVITCLASQFDPVAAALRYIDDVLFGAAARNAVMHYVGTSLGSDPGRWSSIWAAQGGDMALLLPDEVEEIRLAALLSLSDMGAEGIPEVINSIRVLFTSGSEILRQAAFDSMANMCRIGFRVYPGLASMEFSAEDTVEGENWRLRRYASNIRIAAFAAGISEQMLRGELETAVFVSAADCLGSALSYPDDFPDPDGMLAQARQEGEGFLEQLLMRPDIGKEKRAAAAKALGEIGTARAVSSLSSIIESPYCSPEAGVDGTRMAEAVIDALRAAALGNRSGKSDARRILLELMKDTRVFPALRTNAPPVGLAHMVLWRLQRLARTTDISMEPEVWRQRLNW